MKILLDMNLSPAWVPFLEHEGYEVRHWSHIGPYDAPDTEVMDWARKNNYVVFTHDLDFGALLYVTNARAPTVVQLRCEDVRPKSVGKSVLEALRKVRSEIEKGALVVIDPRKNRVRLLPLRGEGR